MSKEIKAIEISREVFSVGSTYTEGVALQSFLSECRVRPLKQKPCWLYVGCLVYGMSSSCRQRRWVAELLQPGEETRAVCAWSAGLFPSPSQKMTQALAAEKMWSEAPRWKGAPGPATISSITTFLTPRSKASAHFLMFFEKMM